MYNLFPFFIAAVFFILGVYMVINPKKSVKEEFRNDEKKVAGAKRNGFIYIALAVVMIIIGIAMPK
ncbi:MAG: hypothetical protein IJV31_03560 [Clostridia bacterium]|nr:hypothetical protein [Clostridia bacterium]